MKVHDHRCGILPRLLQLAWLATGLVIAVPCFAAQAEQHNAVQLKVKPNRCISLHQGQRCYQQIRLSWQTPTDGRYCLYVEHRQSALTCWQGATQTEYHYAFEASESTHFDIRPEGEAQVLGRVKVQVASVYKTSTRSHARWRLF